MVRAPGAEPGCGVWAKAAQGRSRMQAAARRLRFLVVDVWITEPPLPLAGETLRVGLCAWSALILKLRLRCWKDIVRSSDPDVQGGQKKDADQKRADQPADNDDGEGTLRV
jgi:hypothetical protein